MHMDLKMENLKGTEHLASIDIDLRVVLNWILKEEDVDWIQLADDRV